MPDDFSFSRGDAPVNKVPRWDGTAAVSLDTVNGELQVTGDTNGGDVHLLGFGDDDYIVQYDANRNSAKAATGLVRYVDANNHYRIELGSTLIRLSKLERGNHTLITSRFETGT